MDKDPLDVELALERLTKALPLQLRSAAAYTIAAGSITGFQYQGLSDLLWKFAEAELGDSGRILLRPSGTEQVVRVMVEAADEDTARQVAVRVAESVSDQR